MDAKKNMPIYHFQTEEFGISDNGFHLLRSGFNYKIISFEEVTAIRIEKGKELDNWWLIFVFGAALTVFGVYLATGTIKILIKGDIALRQTRMIFLLLIPVAGGYFAYNSLRTGLLLKIECAGGKKYMFPIRDIVREQKLNEMRKFLNQRFTVPV